MYFFRLVYSTKEVQTGVYLMHAEIDRVYITTAIFGRVVSEQPGAKYLCISPIFPKGNVQLFNFCNVFSQLIVDRYSIVEQ